MNWLTLLTLPEPFASLYCHSDPQQAKTWLNVITGLSVLLAMALIPLATWIINHKGLRLCLVSGALINALGSLIRSLATVPGLSALSAFSIVLSGQMIISSAGAFLSCFVKLSALWFESREKNTASGISAQAPCWGNAFAYALAAILLLSFRSNQSRALYITFGVEAVLSILVALVILFVFKSHSSEDDSRMMEPSKQNILLTSWQLLFSSTHMFFYLFIGSLMLALGNVWISSLDLIFGLGNSRIASADLIGWIGVASNLSSIAGSFLFCRIIDLYRISQKKMISIITLSSILCLSCLALVLWTKSRMGSDSVFILSLVFSMLIGALISGGMYTLIFELAASVTCPVPEEMSSGILVFLWQMFQGVFTLVLSIHAFSEDYLNYLLLAGSLALLMSLRFLDASPKKDSLLILTQEAEWTSPSLDN
jgi:MFS family permease